jgi:hypothetical protein
MIESTGKPARRGLVIVACVAAPLALLAFMLLTVSMPVRSAQRASAERALERAAGADGLFVLAAGDWGGQHFAPFTTPGQIDVAYVMAREAKLAHHERKIVLSVSSTELRSRGLGSRAASG